MQPPVQPPMQPPMPRPQAPAGIVGMQSGRTAPTLRGASNQVAAVNAAIESLKSQGRDYTVYSQGELRRMGEDILGTDTVPSLESQGYKRFRPDLGETYELETQRTSIFDPLARAKVGDLFSGVTDPVISAGARAGEVLQDLPRDALDATVDAGVYVRDTASDVVDYVREDQTLGDLGGVLAGGYNLMKDYLPDFPDMGGGEDIALSEDEVPADQIRTGVIDRVNDGPQNEIVINQDALMGSQSEYDALMGSQSGYGFNLPPSSSRAVATDISKLVDKEMSIEGIMAGLNVKAGEMPAVPEGADYSAIAEARAKRGEAASTRMEELIESIQSKAKSDALNMALLNIGAGIAGGDLAGGLDKAGLTAGQIASDARKSTQALELQGITMAEEAARSGEDIQIQEALSDLQRFSVEQGIAKDQRDYNLNLIKLKVDSDLGFQRLTSELAQSENISKRSVLGLIEQIIEEEADNAKITGQPYNAGDRALQLYNPFAGVFGLDALSAEDIAKAREQIGGTQATAAINTADLEAELDAFID
jgi:hypothetical protein